MNGKMLVLLVVAFAFGCGGPESESEDVQQGKDAVTALDYGRKALQFIGVLPSYECGGEERFFVAKILDQAHAEAGCVAVADQADDNADHARLTFSDGCKLGGKRISGAMDVAFSGGDDRDRVQLDLTGVTVDGESIPVRISYGTCGDEARYSAAVSGTLSHTPRRTFDLDLTVKDQDGIVLIGSNTLVLKGSGTIEHPAGDDRVSFDDLSYEMGDVMAKSGDVRVETSKGKHVDVRFDEKFWKFGVATVQVNDDEPVTVPIVH